MKYLEAVSTYITAFNNPIKTTLFSFLLIFAFSSCANKDGDYIIYNLAGDHKAFDYDQFVSRNDVLDAQLKEFLIGKRLKLTFNDKYVLMSSLISPKEVVLTKDPIHGSYVGTYRSQDARYEFSLIKSPFSNEILLAVYCSTTSQLPLILPVQRGGIVNNNITKLVCFLDKQPKP